MSADGWTPDAPFAREYLTDDERETVQNIAYGPDSALAWGTKAERIARLIVAAREGERIRLTTAVVEAFDPGELDCGRLGLPCTSVNPSDRWCRACRIRAALALPDDEGAQA